MANGIAFTSRNRPLPKFSDIMQSIQFAIIGGSGLYSMQGLQQTSELAIATPYGATSDPITVGLLDGVPVAFLARHGRSHALLPTEIPFRANIWALKSLGVKYLISVSAVGSFKESMAPRHMVLPDQFIDLTKHRAQSFFGDGVVAHVSLAQPVCSALSNLLAEAYDAVAGDAAFANSALHRGGTYVCIEGPQFSTLAESRMYRSWDASVIGMTNMPEARLAREAEIAYATLALVTDFDCWHPGHAAVTAEMAIGNLLHNASSAQQVLRAAVARLAASRPVSPAHTALAQALVTQPDAMSAAARTRLAPLLASYL